MTRRLLLHVGTPKTGTSLLQHALHVRRDELAERGLLYPGTRPDAHFLAALDLMQLRWGGLEEQARGAWSALVEQARGWDGDVVVSHEILGAATAAQARRALDELAGPGTEVRLVVSARDLVRQLPAEWQENVKHRRSLTFAEFVAQLRDPRRRRRISRWFWSVQDLPDLLDRWAVGLDPAAVHLVTVPPPGSPPALLWQRYVDAFDLGDHDLRPLGRANASLGVPESAMLRRLNERLNRSSDDPADDPVDDPVEASEDDEWEDDDHDTAVAGLPSEHYRPLVRELVVHRHLAGRPGSPPLRLPPSLHGWATGLSAAWVEELAGRGLTVHGDLDDLRGAAEPDVDAVDPDSPDEAAVADAALDALAIMTREAAALRERDAAHEAHVADLRAQLDVQYGRAAYRAKQRLVRLAHDNAALRLGYRGYRRWRSSSSRSA